MEVIAKRKLRLLAIPLLFAAVLSAMSCGTIAPSPPYSLRQYEQMRVKAPVAFAKRTILTTNVQRALDGDLPTAHRVESLRLALHLGGAEPFVADRLATLLSEENSPYEIHQTVFAYLLERNHPGLVGYVIPALSRGDLDPTLRDSLLLWLSRNPSTEVLAEIVKNWAEEESSTGVNEPRYRHIVERISGRPWDRALLAQINGSGEFPRGEAIEILARRIPASSLRNRLLQLQPNSTAMASLQSFAENFQYLPTTKAEFDAVDKIFTVRLEMIRDAAQLEMQWRDRYAYNFNIRDFHLLSRLAQDPLRTTLARSRLILQLRNTFATRQHVPGASRLGSGGSRSDRFGLQVGSLTIGDLWNLYLLNEMLSRPRMQLALRIMGRKSRTTNGGPNAGLVFYQHGQAEAMLYPLGEASARQMNQDGYDALSRFETRFEKIYNTGQAGPDQEDLTRSKKGNYYGLVLTSVNEYSFCAHYYNPAGRVVSLGKFPFRQ